MADYHRAVVVDCDDDDAPCKIFGGGDDRHFTFSVDYEAAMQFDAGTRLRTACRIGEVYRCEASFQFLHKPAPEENRVGLAVLVSGPISHPAGVHRIMVDIVLLGNTKSVAMQPPAVRSKVIPLPAGGDGGCKAACGLLVLTDYLEANCLHDGTMVALFSVSFVEGLPPCLSHDSLGHRLAAMAREQDLTDVCFDVGGERFSAHRTVMAAQSEVFRALLLGPMAESKMATVPIRGISASTFRHMLHYIYCNELPAACSDGGPGHAKGAAAELQRLLVAADMYGLETLKQMCEDTLCAGVGMDTVTSALALTKSGSYPKLRASCIEFLSTTQLFTVATTDELCEVARTYPGVLAEIRDMYNVPPLPKRPCRRSSPEKTPSSTDEDTHNLEE
ncbi:BTB/POZ and MATH domain-containing protein 2-like [Oryza brachyantha]|uniref:BTB domain-containing protein n=1 Tax=Oryza brachyantha TaxID=4533 RepID=J3MWM9_ORYBR|nr:BTB/POZ and MATH domain-containing protein 2-like [Oryza brachyantha]